MEYSSERVSKQTKKSETAVHRPSGCFNLFASNTVFAYDFPFITDAHTNAWFLLATRIHLNLSCEPTTRPP